MTFYFVAPFHGVLTNYISIFAAISNSELTLDIQDYEVQLKSYWLPKWPKMHIGGPDRFSFLVWDLFYEPKGQYNGRARLSKRDQKTITLDIFHPEFILWHRSVIPMSYRLVLYADTSEKFLELTSHTSHEQLMGWFMTLHDE